MSDYYPTSSISGLMAHGQHQYEPLPGRDADPPWNPSAHPRTLGQIDEQNDKLVRKVDSLIGKVTNKGTTRSTLVLKDVLTTAHFELAKGRWICLCCALHPTKPRKRTKSGKKTSKIRKVDYATKSDLLQHINRKHICPLVSENYRYEEPICVRRFGMQTDMTAHNKVCAEMCKTLDKLTHQELQHMAEDLRQAALNPKDAMHFAEQALPVFFDEVDGAPVKRYDLSDGTNNLKLRPRINRSTACPTGVAAGGLTASVLMAPRVDPDLEQALRNVFQVFQNIGPLACQRALQIANEMSMVHAGMQQPGPPSTEQTQPLNTGEQLILARKRRRAGSSSQAVPEETAQPPPASAHPHPFFTAAQAHTAAPSSDGADTNYLNTQAPISGTQLAAGPEDWQPPPESGFMEDTGTEFNISDYLQDSTSEDGTSGHLHTTRDTAMSDAQ